MRYRIGEVSKILGLSPETLRFFESKGIVTPQHDPRSAYRYFDSLDVNKLVAYLSYRRMGFSLDEAVLLVSRRSLSFLRDELERRSAAVAAERARLARVQARVDGLSGALARMEQLEGGVEIAECSELVFFANQDDREFRMSDQVTKAAGRWLDDLPEAFPYALFESKGRGAKAQWGFAKPLERGVSPDGEGDAVTERQREGGPGATLIPRERCAHGFFIVPEDDPLFEAAWQSMDEWALRHGSTLAARRHGTILHELGEGGRVQWLLELYAPLEGERFPM